MKKAFNKFGWALIKLFGRRIRDVYSGDILGRGTIFIWRGKVIILGYTGDQPLKPVFLPKKKLSYWCYHLGFTTVELPDYERK